MYLVYTVGPSILNFGLVFYICVCWYVYGLTLGI